MATELMALVQDGKIRPTVAEQITLEAIRRHWNVWWSRQSVLSLCDVGNRKTCHYGLGLTPGKKLPRPLEAICSGGLLLTMISHSVTDQLWMI
jgi:hypothetical protein